MCVAIVLCVFLKRAVDEAREAARKSACHGNLFQIAHALHRYHDAEGSFPPAFASDTNGNRLYSWRVIFSPYFGEFDFYRAYDLEEAWDQPDNLKLANEVDSFGFTCPSGPNSNHRRSNEFVLGNPRFADYVAVVGPGTVFPGRESVSKSQISDGLENTILLVEIAKSKIHWSEPKDLQFDEMSFTINHPTKPSISSPHAAGPGVVFADGRFRRISKTMPPDILKALLTINGGEDISRKDLVRKGLLH